MTLNSDTDNTNSESVLPTQQPNDEPRLVLIMVALAELRAWNVIPIACTVMMNSDVFTIAFNVLE